MKYVEFQKHHYVEGQRPQKSLISKRYALEKFLFLSDFAYHVGFLSHAMLGNSSFCVVAGLFNPFL